MDAFEELVADFLWHEGFWVETSVRVKLSKAQKVAVGRHSTPDWEIDVVAYRGGTNELLAIECKSFFDSTGVKWAEFCDSDEATKGRYKLFCEPSLRHIILQQLRDQLVAEGRCAPGPPAMLGMVAGKIKKGDEQPLSDHFQSRGWLFYGPDWIRAGLTVSRQAATEIRWRPLLQRFFSEPD